MLMMHTKQNKTPFTSSLKLVGKSIKYHYCGLPTYCIFIVIFILSVLAGLRFEANSPLFMAGEIASRTIVSERTLKVEDQRATRTRQDQIMALQPFVFDINKESVQNFNNAILELLTDVSSRSLDNETLIAIQENFNNKYNTDFEISFFEDFANDDIQRYITSNLLPFTEHLLLEGVFADQYILNIGAQPVLIRDQELGHETLLATNIVGHGINNFYLRVAQEVGHTLFSNRIKNSMLELIKSLATPSLNINQEARLKRAESTASAIPTVFYYMQKGEVIVAEGETVSHEQQLKMQALHNVSSSYIDIPKTIGIFILACIVGIGLFISPSASSGSLLYPRVQVFMASLILLFGLLAFGFGEYLDNNMDQFTAHTYAFLFPVAGITGLCTLVFAARRFYSFGFLISLFSSLFLGESLGLFLFYFISAMINTLLIIQSQSRQDVVLSSIVLLFVQIILGTASFFAFMETSDYLLLFSLIIINSFASLVLIFALSPIIEMIFGLTTRFRLMELMSFEHPLLQELMMTTPGTYNHAFIVANLVEAAARTVKANPLLAKVGALYHDIGKLARPEYYVENQHDGINKHDTLAPAMSALIIISHIKQGVDYAKQYKLGQEIIDIITQHHGNRSIVYFYNKALEQHTGEGEAPKEKDFSYPYPKPQSKEAALVMLADAVEASSRMLTEPTPARIESHVKKIIHGIYQEGQLDDSELTFKELSLIADDFTRLLNGLFHKRIAYPDKKK